MSLRKTPLIARSAKTHIAPVLGCGRVKQPGADGGDTRDNPDRKL